MEVPHENPASTIARRHCPRVSIAPCRDPRSVVTRRTCSACNEGVALFPSHQDRQQHSDADR